MAEIQKARLVELSDAKLQDAKLLLQAGSGGNAYYLAGYAVELMLKAILSSQFKADTLPDKALLNDAFTHNFPQLVNLCHLKDDLQARQSADAEFRGLWQIALSWKETSRYGEFSVNEAADLIEAIEKGILPWLRSKL
jgi:HEPN domain-containing protein